MIRTVKRFSVQFLVLALGGKSRFMENCTVTLTLKNNIYNWLPTPAFRISKAVNFSFNHPDFAEAKRNFPHGSLVVLGPGFHPWIPASWQELGHGPFDGPFSFFPGMAMSIAGSGCVVCVCVFFLCKRRRAEPVVEK